jgi:hypothetical protein
MCFVKYCCIAAKLRSLRASSSQQRASSAKQIQFFPPLCSPVRSRPERRPAPESRGKRLSVRRRQSRRNAAVRRSTVMRRQSGFDFRTRRTRFAEIRKGTQTPQHRRHKSKHAAAGNSCASVAYRAAVSHAVWLFDRILLFFPRTRKPSRVTAADVAATPLEVPRKPVTDAGYQWFLDWVMNLY